MKKEIVPLITHVVWIDGENEKEYLVMDYNKNLNTILVVLDFMVGESVMQYCMWYDLNLFNII